MARPPRKREDVEEEILERHSKKIIMLEFNGARNLGKFRCVICGHEWDAIASVVANRTGCQNCQRNNDRLSLEYVQNKLLEDGCELLSEKYINVKEKLHILFSCGHDGWLGYNEFQQGTRCSICGIIKRANSHRTKESTIIDFLTKHNFKFISFPDGFIKQKTSIVSYQCKLGHVTFRTVDNLFHNPTCKKCEFIELAELHKGKNSPVWKGGTTEIRNFASNQLGGWKKDSMESCGYKCVVTGEKFHHIHHLYSFGNIIFDALDNLGLPLHTKTSDYSENEQKMFVEELIRLHYFYPLGVCLSEKVHKLFHKLYGRGDNTPEQFYEFYHKVQVGEIQIQ